MYPGGPNGFTLGGTGIGAFACFSILAFVSVVSSLFILSGVFETAVSSAGLFDLVICGFSSFFFGSPPQPVKSQQASGNKSGKNILATIIDQFGLWHQCIFQVPFSILPAR